MIGVLEKHIEEMQLDADGLHLHPCIMHHNVVLVVEMIGRILAPAEYLAQRIAIKFTDHELQKYAADPEFVG